MEAVRKWEESETTGAKVRQISLSEKGSRRTSIKIGLVRRDHEGQALSGILG